MLIVVVLLRIILENLHLDALLFYITLLGVLKFGTFLVLI